MKLKRKKERDVLHIVNIIYEIMRRLLAAFIDVIHYFFSAVILYFMFISAWKWIRGYFYSYIGGYSPFILMGSYFAILILTIIGFSFISDTLFHRKTLGKAITKYRIETQMDLALGRKWAVYHSFFKFFCIIMYPFVLVYFFFMHSMPYDKVLGIIIFHNKENEEMLRNFLKKIRRSGK